MKKKLKKKRELEETYPTRRQRRRQLPLILLFSVSVSLIPSFFCVQLACRNFSSFFSFFLSLLSYFHVSAFRWKRGEKKRSSGPRHLNLDNRKRDKREREMERGEKPKQKKKGNRVVQVKAEQKRIERKREGKRSRVLSGQATIQFLIKAIYQIGTRL